MIRIAICDEEHGFCQRLEGYISNCMKNDGISYHIDTFNQGERFAALGIGMAQYTVVFLDVKMSKLDGIDIARKIRKISKEIFVVFVTANENYALEGYKVDAVRYILKGAENLQNEINECMNAIIEKLNYQIVRKQFKFSEGTREIALDRLLYIESRLHKLEFHVAEDEMKIYTMYEILDKVANELENDNFIRIHQSYLVNLKYIKAVQRYKVILDNGVELMIPKARYMVVKDGFWEYQRCILEK